MLGPSFDHYQDAIEAGYSRVNRKTDKDISGPSFFGYDYEDSEGNQTVDVWFNKEKNQANQLGCAIPMYPPTEANNG